MSNVHEQTEMSNDRISMQWGRVPGEEARVREGMMKNRMDVSSALLDCGV